MTVYAIIDAPGTFSNRRGVSPVYAVYADLDTAIRRARRWHQVQVIEGDGLTTDDEIYEDSVGRVYPAVWLRGDDVRVEG